MSATVRVIKTATLSGTGSLTLGDIRTVLEGLDAPNESRVTVRTSSDQRGGNHWTITVSWS